MKKINHLEMNSASEIMDKLLQGTNLRASFKKSTLFKFWPKIAGKKFENHSKVENLIERGGEWTLTVACKNAQVTSELTMYKAELLKKLNSYANPLGIEVQDINFSHKIWKNEHSLSAGELNSVQEKNPYAHDLSGFDPEKIELDPEELETIKENVSQNTFATEDQRERMFQTIILDLKTQKYIKSMQAK